MYATSLCWGVDFLSCLTSFGNQIHNVLPTALRTAYFLVNCFELHSYYLHLMAPKSRIRWRWKATEYTLNLTFHFIIQSWSFVCFFSSSQTSFVLTPLNNTVSFTNSSSHLAADFHLGWWVMAPCIHTRGIPFMPYLHSKKKKKRKKKRLFTLFYVYLQNTTYSLQCRSKLK